MNEVERAYREIVEAWRAYEHASREQLAVVLDDFKLRFAYNSGHIENEQITYHDTREVFENGRAVAFTGDVRTLFEIQNLKECHELLLDALADDRELDEEFVLDVHRTLTQGTCDERRWGQGERPGSYKLGDYVVGASDTGSAASDVSQSIRELLDEVTVANSSNVLTAAAYFHLVFESIHPFADGNGRCGRALMNYLLMSCGHPPVIVFDEDKLAYYGALEVWDSDADLQPMRAFLMAEVVRTWHGLL